MLQIETARLFIRQPHDQDFNYFNEWLSNPELTKHVGGVRPQERIQKTIDHIKKNWKEWGFGTGLLFLKENNKVMGSCGITKVEIEGRTEFDLGYLIVKEYWGKGFATEAARAVMTYAIKNFGVDRITARQSGANLASICVAEKLGFKYEKQITETYTDTQHAKLSFYVWTTQK
jgi:ribosomal-protein-alanine N-acetyltransferase